MTSVAGVRWGLVFWEQAGRAYAVITGPGTRTGTAPVPEGATFTGIEFAVGTSLRAAPTLALVDGGIRLPDTTHRTFRLDGARWETPGPDDAEALVKRLVRAGIVVRDLLVVEVLRGHRTAVSGRTVERRFPRRDWIDAGRGPADRAGAHSGGAAGCWRPGRRRRCHP
jgi:hypothetical protein